MRYEYCSQITVTICDHMHLLVKNVGSSKIKLLSDGFLETSSFFVRSITEYSIFRCSFPDPKRSPSQCNVIITYAICLPATNKRKVVKILLIWKLTEHDCFNKDFWRYVCPLRHVRVWACMCVLVSFRTVHHYFIDVAFRILTAFLASFAAQSFDTHSDIFLCNFY